MAINWTPEQKKVIEDRNRNMLVSAAAGSGKTAVLVERILSLLTEPGSSTELDRLLVVTFTRAAAGEMKERIRMRLEQMIAADGENERLRRQAVLIHNAQISTIHSFCSHVIKTYFYETGIDPMFRIMDEGEEKLMKADCMHEVLEEAFDAEEEDVLELVMSCGSAKSTAGFEKRMLEIYDTVYAGCWPEAWLDAAEQNWICDSEEAWEASEVVRDFMEETGVLLAELRDIILQNLKDAEGSGGPSAYIPVLERELEQIDHLLAQTDFSSLQAAFAQLQFDRMPGKKGKDEDPALREKVKNARDACKNALLEYGARYFAATAREIVAEMEPGHRLVAALCRLLRMFADRFAQKKRQQNLMNYGDLEHFALQILVRRNADGTVERTDAARELAARFDQVMIDEYQDSNEIQELILWSVSGGDRQTNNRFMVGDIKQSIYRFRHARPEIFLEKADAWRTAGTQSEVIDLHRNYRSRSEVVEAVNFFFEKLMDRPLGGTDYDETQRLYAGAEFPAQQQNADHAAEILFLDRKDPDFDGEREKEKQLEAEAAMVASKIRTLREEMTVWDKDLDAYRPLRYSDCVILVRAATDYADVFSRTLVSLGIPAAAMTRTGYFSAVEVQVVLNYLRILDNPLQDIPLASVLFSMIGGLRADDLAYLRLAQPSGRLYTAVRACAESGPDPVLAEKLNRFLSLYDELADRARYLSADELLWEIFRRTDIRAYAAAMPGGAQRCANLDMLLQKAAAFEKTSYSGIFQFIRYIEELQDAKEDFGEAGLYSEAADAVRIMTIHKSKGQEFPVVFLCGCSHGFNKLDMRKPVLVHPKLGFGPDVVDLAGGRRKKSFLKNRIAAEIQREALSEELRILYVALTRAKEKLMMTVVSKDLQKQIEKSLAARNRGKGMLSRFQRASALCYADWLLPVLAAADSFAGAAAWAGLPETVFSVSAPFLKARVVSADSLIRAQKQNDSGLRQHLDMLPDADNARIYDADVNAQLEQIRSFVYPYPDAGHVPAKISVSDLKRMHMAAEEEQTGVVTVTEEEIFPYIPAFMRKEEPAVSGAARGTAYHRFWSVLDYPALPPLDGNADPAPALSQMRDRLREQGFLTNEEAESVRIPDMVRFLRSPLGVRMQKAARKGVLVREQPFTMGIDPKEASDAWQSDGLLLVQGVIDAYFEEDGELVLVDYKTDRAAAPDGSDLLQKYAQQLRMYAKALEKSTGKRVKEKIIYSTCLQRCVMM